MPYEEQDSEHPHRGFIRCHDDYIPIGDVIDSLMESGGYENDNDLFENIVEDPLVVSIRGKCRLVDPDRSTTTAIIGLISCFSDSKSIIRVGDHEFVPILDIYYEYRDELRELNILNQYELAAVIERLGIRMYDDLVDTESFLRICNQVLTPPPEVDDPSEQSEDSQDIDGLIALIAEYVRLKSGTVSWEEISHRLDIPRDILDDLRSGLFDLQELSVSDSGVTCEPSETRHAPVTTCLNPNSIEPMMIHIMSDGREHSIDAIRKKLLSEQNLDVRVYALSDCLNSMVRRGLLARVSSRTYRMLNPPRS